MKDAKPSSMYTYIAKCKDDTSGRVGNSGIFLNYIILRSTSYKMRSKCIKTSKYSRKNRTYHLTDSFELTCVPVKYLSKYICNMLVYFCSKFQSVCYFVGRTTGLYPTPIVDKSKSFGRLNYNFETRIACSVETVLGSAQNISGTTLSSPLWQKIRKTQYGRCFWKNQ